MHSCQRLTMVWKQIQNELKLLHVNCTMARDIPIEADSALVSGRLEEDVRWFDYIRRFETTKSGKRWQKENNEEISMGKDGKIDMCKALDVLIADGEARGEARGDARGDARMTDLFTILINENRFDDMKRAVSDRAYRNRLFAKYNISGAEEETEKD